MLSEAKDLTSTVTRFHECARWTGVTDSNRKEWLEGRASLITASRTAALFGMSPFEDAIDVYVDLVTPYQANDVELGLNDPRTWGKALEEAVAMTAAKHFGWTVQMSGALLVSRKYPWLGCTQDAEIQPANDSAWWSYEGKTTGWMNYRDWDEETGMPPEHVFMQVQQQLLVTGAPASIVGCLIGGNRYSKITVMPAPDVHSAIIEVSEDMLDRVKRLDPPPPTWRSRGAIKKLHPGTNGESVTLTAEAMEYTRELLELTKLCKVKGERVEELKNILRLSMGDASFGVLPEPVEGTAKQWKRSLVPVGEHVVPACVQNRFSLVNAEKSSGKAKRVIEFDATVDADNEVNQRIIMKGRGRARR